MSRSALHLSPVAPSAGLIAGQSGYTAEVNKIEFPSGDQIASPASVEIAVSFLGLLVAPVAASKSAIQTCCDPPRPLKNKIRLPSGANCTPLSFACATASFNGSLPLPEDGAIACNHNSGVLVFCSRSTVVTE